MVVPKINIIFIFSIIPGKPRSRGSVPFYFPESSISPGTLFCHSLSKNVGCICTEIYLHRLYVLSPPSIFTLNKEIEEEGIA